MMGDEAAIALDDAPVVAFARLVAVGVDQRDMLEFRAAHKGADGVEQPAPTAIRGYEIRQRSIATT